MAGVTWQNRGITSGSHIDWPGDGGVISAGDSIRSEMKMTAGEDGESCTVTDPSTGGQTLFLYLGGTATVVVNFNLVIDSSTNTKATFTSGDYLLLVSLAATTRISYWRVVLNSGVVLS